MMVFNLHTSRLSEIRTVWPFQNQLKLILKISYFRVQFYGSFTFNRHPIRIARVVMHQFAMADLKLSQKVSSVTTWIILETTRDIRGEDYLRLIG